MPIYPEPQNLDENLQQGTDAIPVMPYREAPATKIYQKQAVNQTKRMVWYSVVILFISILVFGGIGYIVYSQMNQSSDTAQETIANEETGGDSEASEGDGELSDIPEGQVSEGFVVDQVYENVFLPGTIVAYSNAWSYTNETEASEYTNLIKRTITLTKGTSELTISFSPKFVGGCNSQDTDLAKVKDLEGSDLSRYDLSANPAQYYYAPTGTESLSSDCISFLTPLVTTISGTDAPDYARAFPDEGTVQSLVVISLKSDSPDHIAEADAMVSQSQFALVSQ